MKICKINEMWEIKEFREKNEVKQTVLDCKVIDIRNQARFSAKNIEARDTKKVSGFVIVGENLQRGQFLTRDKSGNYRAFTPHQDTEINGILAENATRSGNYGVFVGGLFNAVALASANKIKDISSNNLFAFEMRDKYLNLSVRVKRVPTKWTTYALITVANKYLPENKNTYGDLLENSGFEINYAFASLREMLYFYRIQGRRIKYLDLQKQEKDLFATIG